MSGFYTKVAGVSFTNTGANNENRQRIIRDLLSKGLLNVGQELQLVPEPTNVYDRNAIMVLAPDKRQIGYLSKDVASSVAPQLAQGNQYIATVAEVTGGTADFVYGVNIYLKAVQNPVAVPSAPTIKSAPAPVVNNRPISESKNSQNFVLKATPAPVQQADGKTLCASNDSSLDDLMDSIRDFWVYMPYYGKGRIVDCTVGNKPVLTVCFNDGDHFFTPEALGKSIVAEDSNNEATRELIALVDEYIRKTRPAKPEVQIKPTIQQESHNQFYDHIYTPFEIDRLQTQHLNGDSKSSYLLGMAYKKGAGVERNINKAVSYFESAAFNGNEDAMRELIMYYRANKNYSKQLYWEAKYNKEPAEDWCD